MLGFPRLPHHRCVQDHQDHQQNLDKVESRGTRECHVDPRVEHREAPREYRIREGGILHPVRGGVIDLPLEVEQDKAECRDKDCVGENSLDESPDHLLTIASIGLKALRVEKLNRLSGGVNSLKLPRRGTTLYLVGFVLFLIVFAFLLLTFTRRVEGHSMLPTLEDGDLVILQPTSMSDVKIGDIIVYTYPCYSPGTSVIHRVLDLQPSGFITKGDNNQVTDQVGGIAQYHDGTNDITSTCLEGKVVYVIPYVERLASLPYGVNYLLVILIVFAVVYTEFRARPGEEQKAGAEKIAPVV